MSETAWDPVVEFGWPGRAVSMGEFEVRAVDGVVALTCPHTNCLWELRPGTGAQLWLLRREACLHNSYVHGGYFNWRRPFLLERVADG